MQKSEKIAAGILLFHRSGGQLKVLLAHPGGPFWSKRDLGAWTIPKGMIESGEDHLVAALREFEEEIGFRPTGPYTPLGSVRQKAGKLIHAWGCEGYFETEQLTSNMASVEWQPGSGKQVE